MSSFLLDRDAHDTLAILDVGNHTHTIEATARWGPTGWVNHRTVERPIVFWPSERDEAKLAILRAADLSSDAAIRAALTFLAAEYTPVVWALAKADADTGPSEPAPV